MNLSTEGTGAAMLRRALIANAIFSTISGVLILVFDQRIATLIGVAGLGLWPIGAMLLGFGAYLAWFAKRRTMNTASVVSVIVSDFAWVIGTVILLAGWNSVISVAGVWLLADPGAPTMPACGGRPTTQRS